MEHKENALSLYYYFYYLKHVGYYTVFGFR